MCGRVHLRFGLWKRSNSSLRMLPNLRETHHLAGKWVERSVGHLLENLVKVQTKLFFRFYLFDGTRISLVLEKPDKKKKSEISQVRELKHNTSTVEPRKELGKISHNLLSIPWHFCSIFTYLWVHLLSTSESVPTQPYSEAKAEAYFSTTMFQ